MSKCGRCEVLPAGLPEVGILYVSPPLARTRGTLRRLFWESGLPFGDPLDEVLAVEILPESLDYLCELLLLGDLSEVEFRDCRAILVDKGSAASLGMLSRVQNLATLTAAVRDEWLLDMLREDRLTVHFQPIVPASNQGVIFAYECLLRGLDSEGRLVSPERMFQTACRAGLLFNLDRAARSKAIEISSEVGLASNLFINFDPASIYDPAHCLRSTVDEIERSVLSPDQVVFEISQSEKTKDTEHLRKILDFYRESGFRVALDDLGYGSRKLLEALRPDFAKLDMSFVREVDRDPHRATITSKLLGFAKGLGVIVIAEGVETEKQWRWLVAHGADFAQGHFFAKPAFPPPLSIPACV